MRYGEIIEKAWKITWRYKFLWVLAIFAGVTGPGGGGGSGSGSGGNMPSMPNSSRGGGNPFAGGPSFENLEWLIGILILIAVVWVILALAWMVLSIAARGGLIWAVDQIEGGTVPRLGAAWRVGFSRFWRMLGAGILLGIPMLIIVVVLIVGIAVPIVLAASKGEQYIAGAVGSMCGLLAIGIPIALVVGFTLGIMVPVAERAIILEDAGVMASIKRGWWAFRRRFKDSALMWLVSLGLSWGASLVLAIPIVVLTLMFLVPAIVSGVSGNWGAALGVGGVWLLIIIVLSFFYVAIWGTFSSAMWTIFFRRLVGKEQLPPSPGDYVNAPPVAPGGPFGTPPPYTPAPPVAPSGYVQPVQPGPPMAPQPPNSGAGFVPPPPAAPFAQSVPDAGAAPLPSQPGPPMAQPAAPVGTPAPEPLAPGQIAAPEAPAASEPPGEEDLPGEGTQGAPPNV